MSDIWVFSPSSQPLLHECLQSAIYDDSNDWVKRFKKTKPIVPKQNNINMVSSHKTIDGHTQEKEALIVLDKSKTPFDLPMDDKVLNKEDEFLELIDTDPDLNLELFVNLCTNNEALMSRAAEKLSNISVDKICSNIFNKTFDKTFIKLFYTIFLYVYVKKNNARLSLDLLLKANAYNSEYFKLLLIKIIKDTNIPNQIFHDLYLNIGCKDKLEVINLIIEINMTEEEFIYHVLTIFNMYKNNKSDKFQSFILNNLITCSVLGSNDRNFGRLMLEYLKSLSEVNSGIYLNLEHAVTIHRSPFKNPLLNLLKKLQDNLNNLSCSYSYN